MATTTTKYLQGLRQAFADHDGAELWERFERVRRGATPEEIERLKKAYPKVPEGLVELLEFVNGTYYQTFAGVANCCFTLLGAEEEGAEYDLYSVEQMIKGGREEFGYITDRLDGKARGEMEVDPKITNRRKEVCWLGFAAGGGSEQLFVDFSPARGGRCGQIVSFLHDPDELVVLAESFDEYLEMLMERGYDFIDEEVVDALDRL